MQEKWRTTMRQWPSTTLERPTFWIYHLHLGVVSFLGRIVWRPSRQVAGDRNGAVLSALSTIHMAF